MKSNALDAEADAFAADVIRMEGAGTWDELQAVCISIESRHAVEGIAPYFRRAYEAIKTQHAKRVARTLAA